MLLFKSGEFFLYLTFPKYNSDRCFSLELLLTVLLLFKSGEFFLYLTFPKHNSDMCLSLELLLTALTSSCDFAKGSQPGLMVCTTQEQLKIGTLYT